MQTAKLARLLVLLVNCYFLFAATSDAVAGVRPIGAGAFPLSFTDASAWFAHEANDNSKVLTALFYFQGNAGWLTGKTDFKWQVNQNPASIDMTVGTVPIHLKYWQDSDDVEVQGKRYRRTVDNVFLISHIDSQTPTVNGLGVHDLKFKSDDVPSIALLRRDADVWALVTGRPRSVHPLAQNAGVPEEVRAWDEQGLRLLESDQQDQQRKGCELFRRAAEKGYAPAQYRLGYCYESGKGVDQNFATANQWYQRAGEQGYVDAQYKLGHSFRTGRGTEIDLPTALSWYKKAASSGDREALHNIGWMYATGQGTKANQQEAYRWFLEAAKHGEPAAQLEIAKRLNEGNGVPKDPMRAFSWLTVLKAQQSDFPPDDWSQISTIVTSVERQLDATAKKHAEDQALAWMDIIAKWDMDSYSHQ